MRYSKCLSCATLSRTFQMCHIWVQQCHSYTCCTDVPCLRPAVPQLHLMYRCALFEASIATVALAVQMCPVWGQHCHSNNCLPYSYVPCLRPALSQLHLLYRWVMFEAWPGIDFPICELWCFSYLLKRTLPHDLYKLYCTLLGSS
jgi:hypothetical protein